MPKGVSLGSGGSGAAGMADVISLDPEGALTLEPVRVPSFGPSSGSGSRSSDLIGFRVRLPLVGVQGRPGDEAEDLRWAACRMGRPSAGAVTGPGSSTGSAGSGSGSEARCPAYVGRVRMILRFKEAGLEAVSEQVCGTA